MRVHDAFKALKFVGLAEGDKNAYYVFEGPKGYLVVAPRGRNTFNANGVEHAAIDVVSRRFRGRKVTSRKVRAKARRPDLFTDNLAALNALYAMVASGKAKKLRERDGRAMVFRVG
jgi:hypothetical protein